jgi:hypothetical protein
MIDTAPTVQQQADDLARDVLTSSTDLLKT